MGRSWRRQGGNPLVRNRAGLPLSKYVDEGTGLPAWRCRAGGFLWETGGSAGAPPTLNCLGGEGGIPFSAREKHLPRRLGILRTL